MAFRRNFAPAVANSMNLKALQEQSRIDDGTSRANAIAEKDLQFWIPQAALLVPEGVQPVQTWEEFLRYRKLILLYCSSCCFEDIRAEEEN